MNAIAEVRRTACAPSGSAPRGTAGCGAMAPEWQAARAQVMKLQRRIAKAQMAGKRGKVKALQWILTHSVNARMLATQSAGERLGAELSGNCNPSEAVQRLRRHGYRPRALIGKARVPVPNDCAMQALYAMAMEPLAWDACGRKLAEVTGMAENADMRRAQRRAKVRKAADALKWEGAFALRLRVRWQSGDGAGRWLASLPGDGRVLGQLMRRGQLCTGRLYPNGCWHGELAALLAELATGGLERQVKARFGARVCITHHADEIIAVCRNAQTAVRIGEHMGAWLSAHGLEMVDGSTVMADGRVGIDFAGLRLRRRARGCVELLPARPHVRALMDGVRHLTRQCQARPQRELTVRLNRLLCAWAQDYAGIASRRSLEGVDRRVRQCLWRWALRRHPRKGAGWVYARYFGGERDNSPVQCAAYSAAPALARLRGLRPNAGRL